MSFITQDKTNLKYILIVVILAVVVGGGVFWWAQKEEIPSQIIKIDKNNLYSCATDDNCISSCGCECINKNKFCPGDELKECDGYPCQCSNNKCIRKDETVNWEIYRNEEYGFEIKYPPIYQVKEDQKPEEFYDHLAEFSSTNITLFLKAISNIDIYQDFSPKSVAEREISNSSFTYTVAETKIRGYNASITKLDSGTVGSIATIAHPTSNLFIEISCEGICQQFDQMILTFRFIEPVGEFCGISTNGSCNFDSDCISGGCSGQVCQSKNEEPIITTCEWQDCYDEAQYGLECQCVANKCQWAE